MAKRRTVTLLYVSLVILVGLALVLLPVRESPPHHPEPAAESFGPSLSQSEVPFCPPADVAAGQGSAVGDGHHRVFLSWIGSAQSSDPIRNPVGYCVYRSNKESAAGQKLPCNECDRTNSRPLPVSVTSCVDGGVQDNTTYHYVVAAINKYGTLSSPSNDVPAKIPDAFTINASELPDPLPPPCSGNTTPR